MNRNDDFDQTLAAWLRDQAPEAPDRVLDAALERVSAEPQRRGWLQSLLGGSRLTALTRVMAVAAVLAVAVIVGLQFATRTPGVGGPPPSPTDVLTPSPSTMPSPTAIPTPSAAERTPSSECINPPVDVLTLVYQSDPVACYGNAPLTVDAYLSGVGAIDGPCLYVEPAWLACDSWVSLDVVRKTATTTSIILAYVTTSNPLLAAIHPTAEPRDQFMDRNVRVTGHFDDPAAQTCRYAAGSGWPDAEFTASDLISSCRRTFVVTQVMPLAP
jgi:hypothetical protein